MAERSIEPTHVGPAADTAEPAAAFDHDDIVVADPSGCAIAAAAAGTQD